MNALTDLTGQRFGSLVVLKQNTDGHSGQRARWVCQCDCGNETVAFACNLTRDKTRSCGCGRIKHGLSYSPEHYTWTMMIQRCHNVRQQAFHHYGGRGISVCDRWRDSFEAFYADMGPRPGPEYSLDRIDNDGPYSPENCRWTTLEVQQNNRRDNVYVSDGKETKTLSQWSREYGILVGTLKRRLDRGIALQNALTTPTGRKNKASKRQ